MDDSEDDILLVEDMDEPIKSSSQNTSSSQEVLDAEIIPTSSKGKVYSIFSSMAVSLRLMLSKMINALKYLKIIRIAH